MTKTPKPHTPAPAPTPTPTPTPTPSSTEEEHEHHSHTKATIPKALREQVWLRYVGKRYEAKCLVSWCRNTMTVYDFQVGHDVPESHGGATEIGNLRPICSRCNLSMGANYSIQEWSRLSRPSPTGCFAFLFCR